MTSVSIDASQAMMQPSNAGEYVIVAHVAAEIVISRHVWH